MNLQSTVTQQDVGDGDSRLLGVENKARGRGAYDLPILSLAAVSIMLIKGEWSLGKFNGIYLLNIASAEETSELTDRPQALTERLFDPVRDI